MTTIDLTRQAVDQAEALTFPTSDERPLALATLAFHGVPVQLDAAALEVDTLAAYALVWNSQALQATAQKQREGCAA